MLGIITLLVALAAQLGFLVYRLITKNRQTKVRHIMRLAAFTLFSLLLLTGVCWWSFRWMGLFILLAVSALLSIIYFIKKPKAEKEFKRLPAVLSCFSGSILLTFCILPGILFPQFVPVGPTGPYAVETTSVTFTDTSRADPYSETGDKRKLTVQFWYPDNDGADTYPLAVFSHGAFGYRGSNLSTFENLASNGYVVCSIDHSAHAFFAEHTDGSMTFADTAFLNDAIAVTNGDYDAQTTYDMTHEWLTLRTADMDFVLEQVLGNDSGEIPEAVFTRINTDKIGLFGHSLGGAAAAQLGRERSDVDGVIVIDGTMIGEELAYENGQKILNQAPYPVPLLNLYNDSHYQDALREGTAYNNLSASSDALEAYDTVIRGFGHLNFTDLPLFSPTLARMLGTGEVNSRYCIETMNQIALDFFNATLKDSGTLSVQAAY